MEGPKDEIEPASPQIQSENSGRLAADASSRRFFLGKLDLSRDIEKGETRKPTRKKESFLKYFFRPRITGNLGTPRLPFSPSMKWRRLAEEKDGASRAAMIQSENSEPDSVRGFREGFRMPFVGEVRWDRLKKASKDWLRNPKNLAVLIWGIAVAVSGAILFMVMVGMLNRVLPRKKDRDAWFEINNQILNALFTMMCLYQHPQRFYHLALLCRWQQTDIITLRRIYCKNGTYKPREWVHILVVVLLLHLNCFAQYALCGLNWGYKRSERPAIGVGLCLAVAIGAPAMAGIYMIISPLGKDYDYGHELEEEQSGDLQQLADVDVEGSSRRASGGASMKLFERRLSFVPKDGKRLNFIPQWQGDLLDCCRDPEIAYFSTFCGFCVFGWNMDRLGLGNMYVHIVTFLLLCMAPFWIFNLAAININNESIRTGLGISGMILCIFGLLYGGFWRTQMRKKFGLPPSTWCWGRANLADYVQWMFCSLCSLCQEVRTGDYYGLYYDKVHSRRYFVTNPASVNEIQVSTRKSPSPSPSPLNRENDGLSPIPLQALPPPVQCPVSPRNDASLLTKPLHADQHASQIVQAPSTGSDPMQPPSPMSITREDFQL